MLILTTVQIFKHDFLYIFLKSTLCPSWYVIFRNFEKYQSGASIDYIFVNLKQKITDDKEIRHKRTHNYLKKTDKNFIKRKIKYYIKNYNARKKSFSFLNNIKQLQ